MPVKLGKLFSVKLVYQGYKYEEIQTILDVSVGSIISWKNAYNPHSAPKTGTQAKQ